MHPYLSIFRQNTDPYTQYGLKQIDQQKRRSTVERRELCWLRCKTTEPSPSAKKKH